MADLQDQTGSALTDQAGGDLLDQTTAGAGTTVITLALISRRAERSE